MITLFALSNLWMARKRLMTMAGVVRPQTAMRRQGRVGVAVFQRIDAAVEDVVDAHDEIAHTERCWLSRSARKADVPGWSMVELYVGDRLLHLDNERVVPRFAQLCARMKSRPVSGVG